MIINVVGNYANGYVGEIGDLNHLTREMEALGHTVQKVPQDIWKAYCEGEYDEQWEPFLPKENANINIICKWHHFVDGRYIEKLKENTKAPVFYWVWDAMRGGDTWHFEMVKAADLYLANDVRASWYKQMNNVYYFPFDVADGDMSVVGATNKDIDVAFFGSWIGQGDRQVWLKEINKTNPITVFSWNWQDWPEEFKSAHPAVYGEDFNTMIARSKIVLGFSVEPNTWGYWSNRVGKTLLAGGFLLYQYAPGMELFLRDGVEYFSSIEEAREKIDHYLVADTERDEIAKKGFQIGQHRLSSRERVKDLMILAERYLKKGDTTWQR